MIPMSLKECLFFIFIAACFCGCSSSSADNEETTTTTLSIVDKNATTETKALLSNLWAIQKSGFMFGHHADFYSGRTWLYETGKIQSDTYNVCGDYPGVLGVDLAQLIDDRYANSTTHNEMIRQCCLDAYNMGMVILACIHIDNPLTGSDSWDNSNTTVAKEILTEGSDTNLKFKTWLDRLAQFAMNLTGNDGKLIPIILRPFHEHSDGWSWWGSTCTTKDEFIALWQYTVKYLRDTKGVHNFLYAISPDMNSRKTEDDVLFRWPGDGYVDFIGIDSYIGLNNDVFVNNLKMLVNVSKAKLKPCGVTETGVQGFTATNYWTNNILAPMTGREVSMLVTWTNEYGPADLGNHYFSVYEGHPSAADFIDMYKSSIVYFRNDLPKMYTMKEGYTIE